MKNLLEKTQSKYLDNIKYFKNAQGNQCYRYCFKNNPFKVARIKMLHRIVHEQMFQV